MKWALVIGISALGVFSDSQVIVRQVNNEYAVNSDNLKEYVEKVTQLVTQFRYFALEKMDRSNNEVADKLAKIAAEKTPNDLEVEIELFPSPVHIQPLHPATSDPPTWVDEIMNYISQDILPNIKKKAMQILKCAAQYSYLTISYTSALSQSPYYSTSHLTSPRRS